jgi:inosine-uridine nucleoside N-ribohydrolase
MSNHVESWPGRTGRSSAGAGDLATIGDGAAAMGNGPASRPLARGLLVALACLAAGPPAALAADKVRVIIDADTANEVDDFFAIVRGLVAPEIAVEGLSSALWTGPVTGAESVRRSQELNRRILELMGLLGTIPHPIGADHPLPDARTPVDSPAARHIIARARAGAPGERLLVLALGAPTNLASALLLDPTIADRVAFAFIDGDYKDGRWGPGIYNWKNDANAVRVLFEARVPYVHMPAPTVSRDLTMSKGDVDAHLKGRGGVWDFLVERWEAQPKSAGRSRRTLWDVALVEAILRPRLASAEEVGAPLIRDDAMVEQRPDNPRRVTVFRAIDAEGMRADFWAALDAAIAGGSYHPD